jgi:hypothetical protein
MRSTLFLAILFLFVSCSKHNGTASTGTTPPPTDPTPPVTMKITLATSAPNEEIIFSDSGGKVLLDTMSPFPGPLVATLVTAQTLIDVTTIRLDTADTRYIVTTYKAVNPASWSALEPRPYYGVYYPPLPATNATVVYSNTPTLPTGQFLLDDYAQAFNFTNGSPVSGFLNANYTSYDPGNYVYLFIPWSNLYNFHIPPQGKADTVDLSIMDTAGQVTYSKPPGYSDELTTLNGIMDTTNLSRTVRLYINPSKSSGLPDVVYPKKLVQKLELYTSIWINNEVADTYYSYGDSLASSVYYPSPADYTISSNSPTAFSIKFSTVHPTSYNTRWETPSLNLYYIIYASADSTNLIPQSALNNLNSKLLQGQNLSGLTLSDFGFDVEPNTSYVGYNTWLHSPSQARNQNFSSHMNYGITF